MRSSWQRIAVLAVLGTGSTLMGAAASAQATGPTNATQVLDRVNAVSRGAVLDMAFDDPAQALPFETPPEITTARGFTACQLTAERGLFCLDQNLAGAPGRFVRRWDPVFKDNEVGSPYFKCESLPEVDTSKNVETCTGITADENGAVVVAGKRKGGYNLVKVVAKADVGGACTGPWAPLSSTDLCYKVLLPRDRPLLVDVTYGKLTFPGNVTCTGILGLENRTTLMFFADKDAVEDPASCAVTYAEATIVDTRGWNLQRGELLQGATTLKTENGDSFVLVISNYGRVLAKRTDSVMPPFPVTISRANVPYATVAELRNSREDSTAGLPATACDTTAQEFGIRTSTKSGRLYVSDKNYCEVSAFEPAAGTLTSAEDGLEVAVFNGWDLVLATATQPSGPAYSVLEPTLAPGISIDLSKCVSEEGCTLVAAGNGQRVATLSNVTLASKSKGMTLFQIRYLPDCRWIRSTQPPNDWPEVCAGPEFVSNAPPETQYLNITPLLPKEVTDQFPDGLPDMFVSPQYRAQQQNDYLFEAFFGVTQAGVVFQDVFRLEFAVGQLNGQGNELGCVAAPPLRTPVAELLKWDISVTVSEKVPVVGASGKPYSDILVNNDCGSTRAGGVRWSAYTYDLELTPTVYHPLQQDGSPAEDYFAHLVVDLFFDLEDARNDSACQDGGPLATSGVCPGLSSIWLNAKDKLTKCLKDSNFPKTSEAVRNCNSFDSQMANYRATLDSVPLCAPATSCNDPDNRLGELKTRVDTLRHVMNDRLIPSVPEQGWDPGYEGFDPADGSLLDPHP
jgi:hypothetical protein